MSLGSVLLQPQALNAAQRALDERAPNAFVDMLTRMVAEIANDGPGLRIIEEVRSHPEVRNLPIILATGAAAGIRNLRERLDPLDVPVLVKPFEIATLEESLRVVLEGRDA